MNLQYRLAIQLNERLGYGESVTLTRNEFNLLVDGDLDYAKELKEEVAELESKLNDCNCDELQEKLNRIIKIAED